MYGYDRVLCQTRLLPIMRPTHICNIFHGENFGAFPNYAMSFHGLNASLRKFLCLNASFFSTNDEVTREQRQQLITQAEECEILLWDIS